MYLDSEVHTQYIHAPGYCNLSSCHYLHPVDARVTPVKTERQIPQFSYCVLVPGNETPVNWPRVHGPLKKNIVIYNIIIIPF